MSLTPYQLRTKVYIACAKVEAEIASVEREALTPIQRQGLDTTAELTESLSDFLEDEIPTGFIELLSWEDVVWTMLRRLASAEEAWKLGLRMVKGGSP